MAEDGDPVKKGDVVVRFDALEVTKRVADGQSDRAAAESRIEKEKTLSQSSLHERDRTTAVTREELDSNRQLGKKDPRFFPGPR
jgi:multidrug efflux pump subunit AcrA (membrane-fusion protein)